MYNLKYKIWLDNNGKAFGIGPCQLLKGVSETGSLNKAAKTMEMSYSQAHTLFKTLSKRLGFPLIMGRTGGVDGGGTVVTEEAKELMKKYEAFMSECDSFIQSTFQKYFGDQT